jgi:uncharacterized protein YbjQ (UPF0145 family)
MLTSTTHTIEGNPIKEYIWFVSSEVIVGANVVKDLFASITDIFGGRSGSYEQSLIEWKNEAMQELITKAKKMWANAIVGIDLAYDTVWKWGSMFMINITWTAVILTKDHK